ncbi:MAG: ABC transporter ATP-binding protein [SAR324 cluster bacterium]|nr:ABC transporter ATP-binding protein [SAR324 cluster bacterium]
MTTKKIAVRFEKVSKIFDKDVVAVDNVSFSIEAGSLVTLLGPSGCGKTTILRMVAGLEFPSKGKIFIENEDVSLLPATKRDVSMVFQSYALFPHMNVAQNVAYGLKASSVPKDEIDSRTEEVLKLVGLTGFDKRLPSELSGGQQQRVAVSRALVLKPQVLLFDEPLSNLDAKLRRQVREEIRDIQQQLHLSVIYVTHDQEEALAVSDRVIVMRNASIAQSGTPFELYETPNDVFVADFIGDANLLDINILSIKGDLAEISLGNNKKLTLPHKGLVQNKIKLAVRPESIFLLDQDKDAYLQGTVAKISYLGSHLEYLINTKLGQLFVKDKNVLRPFSAGSDVWIGLAKHGVSLVSL